MVTEWVRVEDATPPEKVDVLVFIDGDFTPVQTGIFMGGIWRDMDWDIIVPSHWSHITKPGEGSC